jgi:hypothetical protein
MRISKLAQDFLALLFHAGHQFSRQPITLPHMGFS